MKSRKNIYEDKTADIIIGIGGGLATYTTVPRCRPGRTFGGGLERRAAERLQIWRCRSHPRRWPDWPSYSSSSQEQRCKSDHCHRDGRQTTRICDQVRGHHSLRSYKDKCG
ncbi:hypothetical protein LB505_008098 [Fusarium chuoi]|nr:hypothetical protein LB505_008098 [Fusarium chuoi]